MGPKCTHVLTRPSAAARRNPAGVTAPARFQKVLTPYVINDLHSLPLLTLFITSYSIDPHHGFNVRSYVACEKCSIGNALFHFPIWLRNAKRIDSERAPITTCFNHSGIGNAGWIVLIILELGYDRRPIQSSVAFGCPAPFVYFHFGMLMRTKYHNTVIHSL